MGNANNLYVADTGNYRIEEVAPTGTNWGISNFAGVGWPYKGSADGPGTDATFRSPSGVAVDTNGNVYVADTDNKVIRKITPEGYVTTVAGLAGSCRAMLMALA